LSHDHLDRLWRDRVFDPHPFALDLDAYYVPFDELLANRATEARLITTATAGGRIAVVGPSGSGKSSLLARIFGPMSPDFAAMRISTGYESEQTLTDPKAFAQHVCRVLTLQATEVAQMSTAQREELLRATSDRTRKPGRERTSRGSVGFPTWLLQGSLGSDVKQSAEGIDQDRSASEIIAGLAKILDRIKAVEPQAFLLLDDTDRWLAVETGEPRATLVNGFFGQVFRMIVDLPVGFAVAVHETYLSVPGYQEAARNFIDAVIQLPPLPSSSGLMRVLQQRLDAHETGMSIDDVLANDALALLMSSYALHRSLRTMILAVQTSLGIALEAQAPQISEAHARAALLDYTPTSTLP
jgi:energy-coupling factor transporter ATP-binding protein EcfA2